MRRNNKPQTELISDFVVETGKEKGLIRKKYGGRGSTLNEESPLIGLRSSGSGLEKKFIFPFKESFNAG